MAKPEDIKLSEHFKLSEFCKTSRAQYIEANMNFALTKKDILINLSENVLEKIRAHMIKMYSMKSLVVTSGVRCPELNKAVGGAASSQHSHAEACDFIVDGKAELTKQVYRDIVEGRVEGLNLNLISQCILERSVRNDGSKSYWIHIAVMTPRFVDARKQSGRPANGKEFLVTLTGKSGSYVPASEEIYSKYI